MYYIASFHAGALSWLNWKLAMLDFHNGGKLDKTKEKPLEQGENHKQTQPKYTCS